MVRQNNQNEAFQFKIEMSYMDDTVNKSFLCVSIDSLMFILASCLGASEVVKPGCKTSRLERN